MAKGPILNPTTARSGRFHWIMAAVILIAIAIGVAAWLSSVAAITLMNVIEDEFGFEMDLDDLADLDSFEKLYSYLQKRHQVA